VHIVPVVCRRLAVVAALVGALALVAPGVRAEEVLRLDGPVTDPGGALDGRSADVADAIDSTLDAHGVQVFVLFVGSTEDLSARDYAAQTAETNSLGVDDALLLVAVDDRSDFIWVSDSLDEITDDELDAILTETLEPSLRDGDFVGGAIAAVEALGVAADSPAPTAPPVEPEPTVAPAPGGGDADGSGGIGLGTIIGIVLVAGGGVYLFRRWRRTKDAPVTPGGGEAPAELHGPELSRQANALLIATDERIRDARQEVDFAEAQYGPDEVIDLRTAVAAAQAELAAAFTVRQRLDDDQPEDDATRDVMLREIVERTTRAQATLDAETDRIRQLRDLERDAPTTLVELPARIEAVEDRLPAARAVLADLTRYAPSAWQPVRGHIEEVEKGLAGARTAVTVGSAAMARDERSEVAIATREALEGVTGSAGLLDAIDGLATTIAEAEARVPTELTEADRDLADARIALTEAGPGDTSLGARIRDSEAALGAAHRASTTRPADPVEALRLATEAHRLADTLLVAARDAASAHDRLEAAADSSVRTASVEVDRTATFIASRRRGVGETARTRLAEAERHLEMARGLAATDPNQAVEIGRRSQALAQEAYRLASSDFSDWDGGGPGWGQRSPSGDATAEVLGQILGGILGGVVRGSGGGWGGSPWGGSSGGRGGGGLGGGWGGGGGFGSGGFGGGGGGGGGGAGGGRGRGGRW
jgi:uncharacterized membrane protein YgcG